MRENAHLKKLSMGKLYNEIKQAKAVCTKLLSKASEDVTELAIGQPKEIFLMKGEEPVFIKINVGRLKSFMKLTIRYEKAFGEEAGGGPGVWVAEG